MKLIILIVSIFTSLNIYGQDTLTYKGVLGEMFLLETIELYPDSTFKWTNEYDLTWSEYGNYKVIGNKLVLDYYIFSGYPKTMRLKNSISFSSNKLKTKIYEIESTRIYPLSEKGQRIIKMKDPYYRRRWSWLFGNKYRYCVSTNNKL